MYEAGIKSLKKNTSIENNIISNIDDDKDDNKYLVKTLYIFNESSIGLK